MFKEDSFNGTAGVKLVSFPRLIEPVDCEPVKGLFSRFHPGARLGD